MRTAQSLTPWQRYAGVEFMTRQSPVDRLLAESERLREELLRTAARLEGFSEELLAEVRQLRAEASPPDTGGSDSDTGT